MLERALYGYGYRDMLHWLLMNGLISEETYYSVSDTQSTTLNPREKASVLVQDIRLKVRHNPENYHLLIRYFSEYEYHKDILNILNMKYEELTQPPPREYS